MKPNAKPDIIMTIQFVHLHPRYLAAINKVLDVVTGLHGSLLRYKATYNRSESGSIERPYGPDRESQGPILIGHNITDGTRRIGNHSTTCHCSKESYDYHLWQGRGKSAGDDQDGEKKHATYIHRTTSIHLTNRSQDHTPNSKTND